MKNTTNNITVHQKEKDTALIVNVETEKLNLASFDENGERIGEWFIKRSDGKKSIKPSLLKIAGLSLAAVALVSTLVYLLNLPPWEERVYNRYYERMDKGAVSLFDNSDFSQATEWYRQGKSEEAWLLIKNLKEEYSIKKELCLYAALSLMDNGNYKEAIVHFGKLMEMPDITPFITPTRLYRGMCYLRVGNISGAVGDLSKISEVDSDVYPKAQKLLKRIKRHSQKER